MKICMTIVLLTSLSLLGACSSSPDLQKRTTTSTTTTTYAPQPVNPYPGAIMEQRSTTTTTRDEPTSR